MREGQLFPNLQKKVIEKSANKEPTWKLENYQKSMQFFNDKWNIDDALNFDIWKTASYMIQQRDQIIELSLKMIPSDNNRIIVVWNNEYWSEGYLISRGWRSTSFYKWHNWFIDQTISWRNNLQKCWF